MNAYSDYRSRIKSGDLIALTHYKWTSWYDLQVQAVRVFTQSEYSHVGIAWEIGGRLFLIESVAPFVRITPMSQLARDGFYHVPLDVPISDAELEFALAEVGTGAYSKWESVLAKLRRLPIGANHAWSCAEFTIWCRALSGVHLGDVATPSAVVRSAQDQGRPVYFVGGEVTP
ncbi:MAG: hypothetical protein V4724_26460 [Pseudomonadota bacterium]